MTKRATRESINRAVYRALEWTTAKLEETTTPAFGHPSFERRGALCAVPEVFSACVEIISKCFEGISKRCECIFICVEYTPTPIEIVSQ